MGKIIHYRAGHTVKSFLEGQDVKTIIALLAMELGCLLLVTYKGLVRYYWPVTILLMLFSAVGCIIAFHFKADRFLMVIVMMLLNIGFMVQQIQDGKNMEVISFLKKFTAAITAALMAAFLYKILADWLSQEYMIFILMLLQYLISCVMAVYGQTVGDISEQGATITLFGITPFEFVKILYIFVAAGLLCKEEKERFHIFKWNIDREMLLIFHTILLSVFFLVCKELGTFMIVYISGLIILWIYGKRRRLSLGLSVLSLVGFISVWVLCDMVLYPMMVEGSLELPGMIKKLISRFGTAIHPETVLAGDGYQGTLGLEAIAIGGWLGIGSERYRLSLPEAANDFVFANVIQTCGLLMGFLLILLFLVFLKRGIDIAGKCEDRYFQGIAASITVMIIVEALVHIGYNTAMLPITGIPLYFISQGFTAILTGMVFVTILLVISTGNMKRTVK